MHATSHHEEFLHPNLIQEEEDKMTVYRKSQYSKSQYIAHQKKKNHSCLTYFQRFDDVIMRPIFIYKYEPELLKKKDEFLELFQKDAANWEKIYLNDQMHGEDLANTRVGGGSVLKHLNSISLKRSHLSPNAGLHSKSILAAERFGRSTIDPSTTSPPLA